MQRRKPVGEAEAGKTPLSKPLSLFIIHGPITADPTPAMKEDDPRQGGLGIRGKEIVEEGDPPRLIGLRGQDPHDSSLTEGVVLWGRFGARSSTRAQVWVNPAAS